MRVGFKDLSVRDEVRISPCDFQTAALKLNPSVTPDNTNAPCIGFGYQRVIACGHHHLDGCLSANLDHIWHRISRGVDQRNKPEKGPGHLLVFIIFVVRR